MRKFEDSPPPAVPAASEQEQEPEPSPAGSSAREQKRALILQGAVDLIGRYGLGKTTVEDIAHRAGLKPASVYYYFSSKEEVFAAVVRHYAEGFGRAVREAVDAAETASDKLVAFLVTRFGYLELLADVTKPAAIEAYPLAEEVVREHRVRQRELVREILELGLARGEFELEDAESLAAGLSAALGVVDRSFVVEGLPAPHEDLRSLLTVFVRGLQKR